MSDHEFGWIQNPNNFQKLKFTVQILLNEDYSFYHKKLVDGYVNYIYDDLKRNNIKRGLMSKPVRLTYSDMVGRVVYNKNAPKKNRSSQMADGVVQLAAGNPNKINKENGSPKPWTDNWTASGYINWALTFHFIEVNKKNDIINITDFGKEFALSKDGNNELSEEESNILKRAVASYPPAVRILFLLKKDKDKYGKKSLVSKFNLGHQLGFTGEAGFTSFDEDEWFNYLNNTPKNKKQKVRSNIEGSADKWARTITSWLKKLNLLEKHKLYKNKDYTPNAYRISLAGELLLKRAIGNSKHSPTYKFVSWHMLATSVQNKVYVQKRRAYTIKAIFNNHAIEGIIEYLKNKNLFDGIGVLKSDIFGLIRFGLNIVIKSNKYYLHDNIYGLEFNDMPNSPSLDDKQLLFITNKLRNKLLNIDPSDIGIIQMAWKKSKSRSKNTTDATLFEIRTIEIMKKYMYLNGTHLGGPHKPDGVVYNRNNDFGIIIDTKEYSNGYNLPINQQREMIDYIKEMKVSKIQYSQNDWWRQMPNNLNNFYYLWIAGSYTGNLESKLKAVHYKTNINGGAMEIIALLKLSNAIYGHNISNNVIPHLMTNDLIDNSRINQYI